LGIDYYFKKNKFIFTFADGLKLLFKELFIPEKTNYFLFLLAPAGTLFLSFTG
jgi:NADH:ubiquinone oxidoreductase subunit H